VLANCRNPFHLDTEAMEPNAQGRKLMDDKCDLGCGLTPTDTTNAHEGDACQIHTVLAVEVGTT
jgi:hypothetical protein